MKGVGGDGASPEIRTGVFFFCQFLSVGVANGFGGIWFASQGLSVEQIGIINAVPLLTMLIITVSVGHVADRAPDWRTVIIVGALVSAVFPIGLFFAEGFWPILVFWAASVVAQTAIIPVADAAAIRLSRRRGFDYGAIRGYGTLGYLIVIVVSGYLVLWFGISMFLPLFVGLAVLRGLAALWLPRFRASPGELGVKLGARRLREVMRPWFVLPLIGFALLHSAHFILNAFQGLLFRDQGIGAETIGWLIAVGAMAETVMFFTFRRFANRFTARNLLLMASAAGVVRWTAMAFSPGVPLLFGLQLLHSLTYALGFLGIMNFIANWTSEDIAAETQGFATVLQEGAAIVAFLGFGWLAGAFGARAYLAPAGIAFLGGFLVWLSLRMKTPKTA